MEHIGLSEDEIHLYSSQIYQDKQNKYDPLLTVKIPFIKNKVNVEANWLDPNISVFKYSNEKSAALPRVRQLRQGQDRVPLPWGGLRS